MSSNDPMNFGEEERAVTATADLESESIEVSRLPSSSSLILTTDICFDKEELEDVIFPFDEPDSNIISSINKSSINSESTSERRSPNDDVDADADADAATETTTGQRPQHEKNVLPDRPSQDVARDTKRILEICYGNAKGEKEDSAKRQKKKKTSKKRRIKNDKELSTALIGDDAVVTENEEKEDSAKREKKKKTSKKRRKKDDKIKKEKTTVQMKSIRDATGKIVRKPRKIKDRHRVVRKDLIKRGKDVKIELSTISEDLNDDDDDDDDDENGNQSNNDSEIFVSISINEEEDIYHDDKDVSNTLKEVEEDDDDDGGGDGGDEDDDLKSEVDEQETDADCHDTEESKMGSCTEDEEDINAERKMNGDECNEEDTVSLEIERCPDAARNNDDSVIPNDVDSVLQTAPIVIATTPIIQLPDIENHLTSPPSVDSTECTSTGGDDLEAKSSTFCGSYRMMICCGALFVVIVAALTVLAFYIISLYDIFPGPSFTPTNSPQADQYPSLRPSLTPTLSPSVSTYLSPADGPSLLVTTLSPSKMLKPSFIPTVTPTSAPTTILNTSSTSCQLPIQTMDVQTLEAENASKKMGNAIISDTNEGYCGEGYLTDLTGIGSGFEFAPLKVNTTGYYRVAVRYNYNEKSAISLDLKIDDTEGGQFDLISTGNETTWMVDGIDNILLRQGEHVIQLLVPTETDDGPHIDWLTLSMLEPVSRFDYLVILLAQLTDVTTPSQSQISALVWMASKDPMDWSSLTDQEIIERYALVQIYYSASGDTWFNTNEWLSEFHACTWYGIACSKEELVTDLMLDNNGLEGRIPTDLFLLTNLILISLDTNSLEGTIPTEIKKFKKLSKLFMQANFLSGFLPSALGSLEYLTNIDLRANDFNGPIPEEIYSITSIEALALSSNDLEGTLSTNIGALTSLRDLDLQNNKLSGTIPTTLGTLTSLTTLVLGYNQLSGSIPRELGLLTNISLIDVSSNRLTGILPPELTLLNDTTIDYYDNDIVD